MNEIPEKWRERPTRNPFTWVEGKLFKKFEEIIKEWQEDGRISEEELASILKALDDPETKIYLDLFLQQYIFGQIFRTELFWALGGLVAGEASGALAGEGVRMGLKNLHAQVIARKLPFKKRQTVAACVMPSFIGANTPLYFLYKKHPELAKYFLLYLKTRRLTNIVESIAQEDRNHFTWRERFYLRRNFRGDEVTTDNIVDMERAVFEQARQKMAKKDNVI